MYLDVIDIQRSRVHTHVIIIMSYFLTINGCTGTSENVQAVLSSKALPHLIRGTVPYLIINYANVTPYT